ncbi:MAG: cryptochrome/photolyase family protein [Limnobacter sp.]|nr:cryptochrome/photolyase family protein [Limnobacter sp.]
MLHPRSNHAVLVLGDQLSLDNPALRLPEGCQPSDVKVFMIESAAESTVVWVHKVRIALFLSAMRHFADLLRQQGYQVVYSNLDETGSLSLVERLSELCTLHNIQALKLAEPGDWRLEQSLVELSKSKNLPIAFLEDSHFMCSRAQFAKWASGYKQMRMEYFYREMRKRYQVLMEQGGPSGEPSSEPLGGQWNFDSENRSAFPKTGPGQIAPPAQFPPDDMTLQVLAEVEARFGDHPGELAHFIWPVNREQALHALAQFIQTRLCNFGDYQDAMWTNTPFGWHSLVSSSINLHLLDPREVIAAAEQAYRKGSAPLAAVEGFIRQVLGWREFIRGVYWLDMPKMRQDNFLKADQPLPQWFWTGNTQMACMKDSIGQTLKYGYAHHIQRLMVLGNFALMAGVVPQQVEDWFLAVYVDAVEWVELPNVAGMALFANGGRFTSKPYIASGAYIKRMSNYCGNCKYKSDEKTGPRACPMTTLYWGFLDKHEAMLKGNPRTALMAKNISRLGDEQRQALRDQVQFTLKNIESL